MGVYCESGENAKACHIDVAIHETITGLGLWGFAPPQRSTRGELDMLMARRRSSAPLWRKRPTRGTGPKDSSPEARYRSLPNADPRLASIRRRRIACWPRHGFPPKEKKYHPQEHGLKMKQSEEPSIPVFQTAEGFAQRQIFFEPGTSEIKTVGHQLGRGIFPCFRSREFELKTGRTRVRPCCLLVF